MAWRDEIAVLKLRSMRGGQFAESDPFVATLNLRGADGRTWRRMEVSDEGQGGCYNYMWLDRSDAPGSMWQGLREAQDRVLAMFVIEEPRERLPGVPEGDDTEYRTFESVVATLVDEFEFKRKIGRKMKTHIVMMKGRDCFTIKCAPTPENIARAKSKNPGAVIVNEVGLAAVSR